MRTLAIAFLLITACSCPPRSGTTPPPPPPDSPPTTPPPSGGRTPAVAADHPLHARVEGTGFKNDCQADTECFKGGCSSEVCSAQGDVVTTCEMPEGGFPTTGASCGCVQNQCIWYTEGGGGGTPTGAAQGMACADGKCAAGLQCLEYYGIAGPQGPKFTSCEIPCMGGQACPTGQRCITIADGPGQVCRPMEDSTKPDGVVGP